MMRRLFWMIVGALLGVTGYRRVSRLIRAVTAGGRRGDRQHAGWTRAGWTRSAILFARDVREGMETYTDRQPRLAGRTLEGQQARAERVDYAKDGR